MIQYFKSLNLYSSISPLGNNLVIFNGIFLCYNSAYAISNKLISYEFIIIGFAP